MFDRSKLLGELAAAGVKFGALGTSTLKKLQSALLVAVPFIYLACVGWLVHRMHHGPPDSVGREAKKSSKGRGARRKPSGYGPVIDGLLSALGRGGSGGAE